MAIKSLTHRYQMNTGWVMEALTHRSQMNTNKVWVTESR